VTQAPLRCKPTMSQDGNPGELADAIDKALAATGVQVKVLANHLGVSPRTLQRYRNGERLTRPFVEAVERECRLESGSLTKLYDANPPESARDGRRRRPTSGAPSTSPRKNGHGPSSSGGSTAESHELRTRVAATLSGFGTALRDHLAVASLVALALAALAVVLVTSSGTGHSRSGRSDSEPAASSSSPRNSGSATAPQSTPPIPSARIPEYADNHLGSPVFAKPDETAVVGVPPRIPYGTRVIVACETPNSTGGTPSVTAFYLIAGGRWKGDYAVSDTMSNGGPLGNTDTPNVDPRVPRCPRSGAN
jgi:hypothetical protein